MNIVKKKDMEYEKKVLQIEENCKLIKLCKI